jgi:hypothetical protein
VAAAAPECGGDITLPREQCRRETGEQPHRKREDGNHGDCACIAENGNRRCVDRVETPDCSSTPLRDEKTGQAAERGEQQALRKRLRQQLAACSPQRETRGTLALPPQVAPEKQVRNVGAGDEENDGGQYS